MEEREKVSKMSSLMKYEVRVISNLVMLYYMRFYLGKEKRERAEKVSSLVKYIV